MTNETKRALLKNLMDNINVVDEDNKLIVLLMNDDYLGDYLSVIEKGEAGETKVYVDDDGSYNCHDADGNIRTFHCSELAMRDIIPAKNYSDDYEETEECKEMKK